MRARDIINGLPAQVRAQIEQYRRDYTGWTQWVEEQPEGYIGIKMARRCAEEVREKAYGYILGLVHAGVINERGRKVLTAYLTVPVREEETV